jgi:hypothetical protein
MGEFCPGWESRIDGGDLESNEACAFPNDQSKSGSGGFNKSITCRPVVRILHWITGLPIISVLSFRGESGVSIE